MLKAARRVTGAGSSDDSDYEFEKEKPKVLQQKEQQPIKSSLKKATSKEAKKPLSVVFNADTDLKGFKTQSKQLIKDDDDSVLKNLFVTQEDDALEEFERDKDAEIEQHLGKKVQKTEIK